MKTTQNKIVYSFLIFLVSIYISSAQSNDLWTEESPTNLLLFQKNSKNSLKQTERIYKLNLESLKEQLKSAPLRKRRSLKNTGITIPFPSKNGLLTNYTITETTTLSPELQKKFPNIKSYIGIATDSTKSIIRFSVSKLGLNSMKFSGDGTSEFIDPYTKDALSYSVYQKSDLEYDTSKVCKTIDNPKTNLSSKNTTVSKSMVNDAKLRTFRLALSCTGEYAEWHLEDQGIPSGATETVKKEAVLSAMNISMTRINGVFEKELAVTMQLVANNDDLIFLDPDTDGYTSDDDSAMLNEVQSKCNNIIGFSNYDIGHLFSTGFSGLAELSSPCTNSKAQGVSGRDPAKGDSFDIDFVAHEMGHQYGATHTFNNSCGGNVSTNTSVEPGSGSTIMGYAGICFPDIQNNSDDYFHGVSLEQIYTNLVFGNSTCAEITDIGVAAPTAIAENDYNIPISTAFVLIGDGTSGTGSLIYTWDQVDTQQATMPPLSSNIGGPLFRSLLGTSSPQRHFPSIETTLSGETGSTWEQLPSVSRTMNFSLTIRDEGIPYGQFAVDKMKVSVINTGEPFKITSQTTTETYFSGTSQTITWNVANTNIAPIAAEYVNILLSTDGGLTFPITLASNILNNGTHNIIIPIVETSEARIKIEAVDNIFYTINAANFIIDKSKFIMTVEENPLRTCFPEDAVYQFEYNTYSGFNEETNFAVTNIPFGTIATFSPTSAIVDGTMVTLTISNISESNTGKHNLELIGTSLTEEKSVTLTLYTDNDVSTKPYLISPANNTENLSTPVYFKWSAETEYNSYIIDIATDIEFSNIVESSTTAFQYYTSNNLEEDTEYFWRVSEINSCTTGDASLIYKFNTGLVEEFTFSNSANIEIPDNDPSGINSVIDISKTIEITDITITLSVNHSYVGDLKMTLKNPEGETIILIENSDKDGSNFSNTIFSDAATQEIDQGTAPYNGTYKPHEELAIYNNTLSIGDWTLNISDNAAQDEGELLDWKITITGIDQGSLGTGTPPADNYPKITKGFSPNGDTINDYWVIENINTTGIENDKFPTANVKIFNIKGQVIYQQDKYQNNWNGTSSNGTKLPIGTYIYEVTFSDAQYKTQKGWLFLKY